MSEVASTLLKVQLSEYIPEVDPVVPDTDGDKGFNPGASNTGFHTVVQSEADSSAAKTTSNAVPIAFFGLAFFILTFIIIALIKKRKNPYAIEGKTARFTKLQVLSAASASIFLAIVFNSAIFSTPYVGPVDTTVSEELTIDADILGTDNSAYIKDTIIIPASEYGYELYISTDDTNDNRLIADSSEGVINSIAAEGALENDTYGFSFVDPAIDNTKFQPIQLKDSGKTSVLSLSPEQTATEQHIDIWYGVRSKELEEDVYRTNIEYLTIGRQTLPLEDITPEICASLETGVIDYEFTNSLGETQYVSKLADGNCWTKPVPTEDPSEPSPVLACPTNWHDAKQNDYDELNIFYDVKNPDTTADPIIVSYDQTVEHPEGGCIADFFETTAIFKANRGPSDFRMPDPITVEATDFEATITMPDIIGDSPLRRRFRGWSLTPDGTAPLYQPEDEIIFTSPSVVLYAIWDEKVPKAILDENGLLNFVYDYYTVQEVIDDIEGYRTAYESAHAPIKTEGQTCRNNACIYRVPEDGGVPWSKSNIIGNDDIVRVNFEESFREFEPKSTREWFEWLNSLIEITNLENLNTSQTTNMESMFAHSQELTSLTLPAGFGSQATNMKTMFSLNTHNGLATLIIPNDTEHPENNFGYSAVYMNGMFSQTVSLTSLTLPTGFGSHAKDMKSMFRGTSALATITIPNDTEHPENNFGYLVEDISFMFANAFALTSLTLPAGFGGNATTMERMFEYEISTGNAPTELRSLTFPAGFGSNTTTMNYMFSGARVLASINYCDSAGNLHENALPADFGSKAEGMSGMFRNNYALTSLTLPAGFGSNATTMGYMFNGTSSLTSLELPAGFGSKAGGMSYMFKGAYRLATLTIPNDTEHPENNFGYSATNVSYMLDNAQALTSLTLPAGFGRVATNMDNMLSNTYNLESLELPASFGSVATSMKAMIQRATSLTHIYVPAGTDWDTGTITSSTSAGMFYGDTLLVGEDGITYSSSNSNNITNAHIGYKDGVPGYFTDVCNLYGTCQTNSGNSAPTNAAPMSINQTEPEETQQSPQSTTEPTESPSNVSPLGVARTSKDYSYLTILFAIAMACLFSGTTMLILIIEKVKRDRREEDDQF